MPYAVRGNPGGDHKGRPTYVGTNPTCRFSRSFPPGFYRMGRRLLQVVLGEVNRELGDECRAAPVRSHSTRIDRREGTVEPGVLGARERIAIALVQVGVEVTQVERELLPSECETNVPVVVALERKATPEAG